MRLHLGINYGILDVDTKTDRNNTKVSYRFEPESIKDWYPFNNAYGYYYNAKLDEIFLSSNSTQTRNNFNPIKPTYLNILVWYNDGVRNDNMRVAGVANHYGIKSIFDNYTMDDVKEGFAKISNVLDSFTKSMILKHDTRNITGDMNRDTKCLVKCSPEENKTYAEIGDVYSMLGVMRKVKECSEAF